MSDVRDNSVNVFIGKTHTGKSICVKDLLYHKADFPVGKVMSGTESANKFYSEFIPSNLILYDWSEVGCDKFVKRQKIITGKKCTDPNYAMCDPRGFYVLDDLMYDTSWIKYITIKKLFMTGRHYNILFIITMQYPLGIPPALRTNIDYVFIFRENIEANRKRIFDNFAGMFPHYQVFCETMDKYTENYGCIVIHNGAQSNNINDQVFHYKAKIHTPFKMCDNMIWELNKKKINLFKPQNIKYNY
jgi:hypothetical protein